MIEDRVVVLMACGALWFGGCTNDGGPAAGDSNAWSELACPSDPGAVLTWRLDGVEAIAGAGQGFVVGGRVLVHGEQPGQTGWFDVETGAWRSLPDPPRVLLGSALVLDERVAESPRLIALGGRPVTPYEGASKNHARDFQALDATREVWQIGTSLPEGRRGAAVAIVGDQLLVMGGDWTSESGASSLVLSYDLTQGMVGPWQELDTLPEPRTRASALVVDRRLFVVGGDLGNFGKSPTVLGSSMLVLDLDTGVWSARPGPPTPRRRLSLVALCGRVLAVGGEGGDSNPSSVVEALDVQTGTWASWPRLPEPRSELGLVVHHGRLVSVASANPTGKPFERLVSGWTGAP